MSKRKKRKTTIFDRLRRQPSDELERAFAQANQLVARDQAAQAVALLEPLINSYPRNPDLYDHLAYAYIHAGNPWAGVTSYERAMTLDRKPSRWLPLATIYLQLELSGLALNAFRQVLKHRLEVPDEKQIHEVIASLEQDLGLVARQFNLPLYKVEQGLSFMDEGQRALHRNDFQASIALNRKAIKLLGSWPPPHNNLALALYFDGQPEQAIAVTRELLKQYPDNLQALSNAIRFLAWSGEVEEAHRLWPALQAVEPVGPNEIMKKAEAAAIVEEDEAVYQLLKPLDEAGTIEPVPGDAWHIPLFLAVAEANTNRLRPARQRLEKLAPSLHFAGSLLEALKARKPGPGWASRYPYFHSSHLLPSRAAQEFLGLIERQDKMPARKFERQMTQLATRYPQLVLIAEKLMIEEGQPEAGIILLTQIATPAAYAALRRFGLSQMGDDDIRLQALTRLLGAKQLDPEEKLQVWSKGKWQEMQLRQYEITTEPEVVYDPKVVQLINQGLEALQRNQEKKAEQLLRRVIELEPRAKEAYNNLGVIYSRWEEHDQAKAMYRKAIEASPLYAFPRVNLALYLLDDDDLEGAETMLAPLTSATRFTPQEMASYNYGQARLAMEKEEYEAARSHLKIALEINPEYQSALELLDRLELVSRMRTGWKRFEEEQRERNQRQRTKQQQSIRTAEPALADVLALYSKEVLTAIGRVVIRGGGWSALKKAQLLERILQELSDPDIIQWLVGKLSDKEREALGEVLAEGGNMAWSEFETRFGNDSKDSPYWQYHEPKSVMGRLRRAGLLAEATVDEKLLVVIPKELRQPLRGIL